MGSTSVVRPREPPDPSPTPNHTRQTHNENCCPRGGDLARLPAFRYRASRKLASLRMMGGQRRGAGVVDRGGLENRCTLAGTVGSNPTPSARRLFAGIRPRPV